MKESTTKSRGILLITATVIALSGCKTVNTGSLDEDTTPTAAPTPAVYTAATYAKALRSASIKLRNQLPSSADTQAILDAKEPRLSYEAKIDEWLDPAQNPDLGPTLKDYFQTIWLMGDRTENVTHQGVNFTVDYDAPANLSTHLVLSGKPWTDILAAEYCIGDDLTTE